jgi:hypothetical protein
MKHLILLLSITFNPRAEVLLELSSEWDGPIYATIGILGLILLIGLCNFRWRLFPDIKFPKYFLLVFGIIAFFIICFAAGAHNLLIGIIAVLFFLAGFSLKRSIEKNPKSTSTG